MRGDTKEEEYNKNGPTTKLQRKMTRKPHQKLKMATMCEKDEVRNKEYVLLVILKDKKQSKKESNINDFHTYISNTKIRKDVEIANKTKQKDKFLAKVTN